MMLVQTIFLRNFVLRVINAKRKNLLVSLTRFHAGFVTVRGVSLNLAWST